MSNTVLTLARGPSRHSTSSRSSRVNTSSLIKTSSRESIRPSRRQIASLPAGGAGPPHAVMFTRGFSSLTVRTGDLARLETVAPAGGGALRPRPDVPVNASGLTAPQWVEAHLAQGRMLHSRVEEGLLPVPRQCLLSTSRDLPSGPFVQRTLLVCDPPPQLAEHGDQGSIRHLIKTGKGRFRVPQCLAPQLQTSDGFLQHHWHAHVNYHVGRRFHANLSAALDDHRASCPGGVDVDVGFIEEGPLRGGFGTFRGMKSRLIGFALRRAELAEQLYDESFLQWPSEALREARPDLI
ncbi:hypothetical protein EYF80_005801 [Liparis tanakae]|uniref:Uncharacterized protein n=1 Tax=Liparis tanakae TaxID=230148 RepID=A0A4Z2J0Y1_9TELE|nr:hypothetical protein EYF80_005801 [Liparis tanakae]